MARIGDDSQRWRIGEQFKPKKKKKKEKDEVEEGGCDGKPRKGGRLEEGGKRGGGDVNKKG